MWITSKQYGLFNTDGIARFEEYMGATYVHAIGGERLLLSQKPQIKKITAALKRGADFVEVE